jgi:2-oxo-3-hexenedioate decarboxylase
MSSLTLAQINSAAEILLEACNKASAIERMTSKFGEFSTEDAYRIQLAGMKKRCDSGAKQIGWKMGLTSESKRKQMSLNSAIFGYLLGNTLLDGATISPKGLIHPKGEPEIAFRMRRSIKGIVDRKTVQASIGTYCSAIEIIDSRYIGFKYFSLSDVIADNCSSGKFLLSEEVRYDSSIDLSKAMMRFSVSGETTAVPASEISGDPINSLLQLCELLNTFDLEIKEGDIVLAGASTPAAELIPGRSFSLAVDGCANLAFSVI